MTPTRQTIDVRKIVPEERHPLLVAALGSLAPDDAIEIVNDHDPSPLHRMLQTRRPDQFEWVWLANGPHEWRARITRRKAAARSDTCCGGCGGA